MSLCHSVCLRCILSASIVLCLPSLRSVANRFGILYMIVLVVMLKTIALSISQICPLSSVDMDIAIVN